MKSLKFIIYLQHSIYTAIYWKICLKQDALLKDLIIILNIRHLLKWYLVCNPQIPQFYSIKFKTKKVKNIRLHSDTSIKWRWYKRLSFSFCMYSTLKGLVSFVRYNFPDQACQKNMLHSDLIIFFFKFSKPSKDSWKHLNACQNAKWKCIIQLKIMLCVTANPIHHIMLFFICHTLLFRYAYKY